MLKNQKIFITFLLILIISLTCGQDKRVTSIEEEETFYPPDTSVNNSEAVIWYLGHCGFAVKTKNNFLIFDYEEKFDESRLGRPDNPQLANGYINPGEIRDFRVSVFVTHSHSDHYDPVIFDWENFFENINYYFGWLDGTTEKYNHMEGPRAEINTDEIFI